MCAADRLGAVEDVDPEVKSNVVNLSYHSETEESSDSYYGLVEESLKSPERASFVGGLFDFSEPSNSSRISKLCSSNRNKNDFDTLSFHSSSDDKFISDKDDKDSDSEAIDNVEEEDIYKFKETDSNVISQYVYEPNPTIVNGIKIRPSCSVPDCAAKASANSKDIISSLLGDRNQVDRKNKLLHHLRSQERTGLSVKGFYFGAQFLCPKCFAVESGLSI